MPFLFLKTVQVDAVSCVRRETLDGSSGFTNNKGKQEIYICRFFIAIETALMGRMNVLIKGWGIVGALNVVTKFFLSKNY